jgi:hypothetical protein
MLWRQKFTELQENIEFNRFMNQLFYELKAEQEDKEETVAEALGDDVSAVDEMLLSADYQADLDQQTDHTAEDLH